MEMVRYSWILVLQPTLTFIDTPTFFAKTDVIEKKTTGKAEMGLIELVFGEVNQNDHENKGAVVIMKLNARKKRPEVR